MTKTRESNFELLRIVCMLLIVMRHMAPLTTDFCDPIYYPTHVVNPFAAVAVNAFVLISGYWGITFKVDRLLRLCLQTWFYSVGTLLVMLLLGMHVFEFRKDILFFVPVFSKQYWFVTAYFALYCLAPILNKAIDFFSKSIIERFLLIGFVLFYLWATLCWLLNAGQLVPDSGFGIVNFVYLYFLGRYFRLYYIDKLGAAWYLGGYVFMSLLLFFSQLMLTKILGFEFTSWISYNTIFVLGGAVCLFLFFKNISVKSKIINNLSSTCLAVYLLHKTPAWEFVCDYFCLTNNEYLPYVSKVLIVPIIIYFIGYLVEKSRQLLFSNLENYICSKLIPNK